MSLAISYISTDSVTYFQVFCNHEYIGMDSISKAMTFPTNNFQIGPAYEG